MPDDRVYTLRVEAVDIGKFAPSEVEHIGARIGLFSAEEASRFDALWFQVRNSRSAVTLHVPPSMIPFIFEGIASVADRRRQTRETKEIMAKSPPPPSEAETALGPLSRDDPRVEVLLRDIQSIPSSIVYLDEENGILLGTGG